MAKVSDIKFEIDGMKYVVHVNCNSAGQFSANLPAEVANALSVQPKLWGLTLKEVDDAFNAALKKYKNRVTTEELMIAIRYGSCGKFSQLKNGNPMFYHNGSGRGYGIRLDWGTNQDSALLFCHKVVIKETIDKVVKWYDAQLGKDFPHWDKEQKDNPKKYYKHGESGHSHDEKWKMIPFSDEALESLENATEKIRSVSSMLYDFIKQDEKKIEQTLLNGGTKLLGK